MSLEGSKRPTDNARECWICASPESRLWKSRNLNRELRPEDLQITDSRYGVTLTLYECLQCGFIFAEPSEVQDLVALYEQLVDQDYEHGMDNRSLQMRWLIDVGLRERPGAKTLLEVGSGIGLLLQEAARRGLDAVGVEPSKALVETAKRLNVTNIVQGTFPHPALVDREFDLIYMVDVIEHVTNPVWLLNRCAEALKPGGLLIVVTPDSGSLAARVLGRRWWHLRLAHVGYFNRKAMDRAALAADLRISHMERALWFFPIHYLAERLGVYLPITALVRTTARLPMFRSLYSQIVPLNLRDSMLLAITRRAQ